VKNASKLKSKIKIDRIGRKEKSESLDLYMCVGAFTKIRPFGRNSSAVVVMTGQPSIKGEKLMCI
jgi:hypothetical protein